MLRKWISSVELRFWSRLLESIFSTLPNPNRTQSAPRASTPSRVAADANSPPLIGLISSGSESALTRSAPKAREGELFAGRGGLLAAVKGARRLGQRRPRRSNGGFFRVREAGDRRGAGLLDWRDGGRGGNGNFLQPRRGFTFVCRVRGVSRLFDRCSRVGRQGRGANEINNKQRFNNFEI